MVKISFSWCQMARLWSRYRTIFLLFEWAMRKHLGFVVVSIARVSSSVSVCSSSLWKSSSAISSASFSFCFSDLISSCSSWGCCCCCVASSRSHLRLLIVVSFSSWVSFRSCMIFCTSLVSSSLVMMLFWVVVYPVWLSIALLFESFRFFIWYWDFFCWAVRADACFSSSLLLLSSWCFRLWPASCLSWGPRFVGFYLFILFLFYYYYFFFFFFGGGGFDSVFSWSICCCNSMVVVQW